MPTYEYQCKTCGHRFERFQKMTDPAVTECPTCGEAVRKLIHPPAIAFKGPGFYVNDYKDGGKPATAAKAGEEKPADKPAAGEEKPAESKPAAAPAKPAADAAAKPKSE